MRLVALSITAALVSPTVVAQTVVQSFVHSGTFAGGVAYDYVNDTIWVIDSSTDSVTHYSRTGTLITTFSAPTSQVIGGFVHPVSGNLWIVDEGEIVYEMTPAGVQIGTPWTTAPAITDASAMTHNPFTDTVYVSNDSSNLIAEYDLAGNSIGTPISVAGAGSGDADGLTYNPRTGTFFLGEDTGDQILEVDLLGNLVNSWALGGIPISPEGLAMDTRTGSLFIGGGLAQVAVFEVSGILATPTGVTMAYGMGCADSGGTTPVAHVSDWPNAGSAISFGAQFSPSINSLFGFVVVGVANGSTSLAGFGAPNCTGLTAPFPPGDFASVPIHAGRSGFTVSWPFPAGVGVALQFGIFPDIGAGSGGPLPIALTNGVAIQG